MGLRQDLESARMGHGSVELWPVWHEFLLRVMGTKHAILRDVFAHPCSVREATLILDSTVCIL